MVQLFWGCFFDDVAVPFETSHFDPFLFQKLYDLDDPSLFDMFNHQYIYQYKIQYILPNTFTNKESIAQEDSLHNQLKNFISYPLIVWGGGGRGGGGGFINHFPTL